MASTSFSDLEELLEPQQSPEPSLNTWGRRAWRVAVLLGGTALVAGTAWSVKGERPARGGRHVTDLEEDDCFETGMFYAEPIKMDGSERTVELTVDACQQRCQLLEDCAHFSFWPDGGCLLTADISYPKAAPAKYAATVSGPKYCGVVEEDEGEDEETATEGRSGLVAPDSGSSGLVAPDSSSSGLVVPTPAVPAVSTWGDAEAPTVVPVVAAVAGVNGTTCSFYPACVAAGITEGDCCPNADQVSLGCCNGFPQVLEEVKIAAGTQCSLFPGCVALNITEGACCPTADGIQLGCCESI